MTPARQHRGLVLLAAALVAGSLVLAFLVTRETPFLRSGGGAEWILLDEPFELSARPPGELRAEYHLRFSVDRDTAPADLELWTLGVAGVLLDDVLLEAPIGGPRSWTRPARLRLPALDAGPHDLRIQVVHRMGPPAIRARAEALGIGTGRHWRGRSRGEGPRAVREADDPRRPELAERFPRAPEAARELLPLFLAAFGIGCALWWLAAGGRSALPFPPDLGVRWVLWGLWTAMALNNLWKVPIGAGFDVEGHLEYIRHVARTWLPPLPAEGWQTFQSPLYYYLSAVPYRLLRPPLGEAVAVHLLRLIPLFAGACQIELSWRALRFAFPASPGTRAAALTVAGLLPMNLYSSHYLGNEPLTGALIGLHLLLLLRVIEDPEKGRRLGSLALLGLTWGLALLAKATAVLLAPLLAGCLLWAARSRNEPAPRALPGTAFATGIAALLSAPYYLRNAWLAGAPFVGGWDAERIPWWQDPGYRVPEHLLRFGGSLVQPIYASTLGLWDSLYSTLWTDGFLGSAVVLDGRPPWRLPHLTALALLSLFPTALILVGAIRGLMLRRRALAFATAATAVFLGALILLYLRLPIYSTGKATYLLGLTALLGVSFGGGWEALPRRNRWGWLATGALIAWATLAYLTFYVP